MKEVLIIVSCVSEGFISLKVYSWVVNYILGYSSYRVRKNFLL